jgi:hypothetical protein
MLLRLAAEGRWSALLVESRVLLLQQLLLLHAEM